MQLYQIQVSKTAIYRTAPARIPKGITGAVVRLSFSPEWQTLRKTVVFRAGTVTKDVVDVQDTVVIPVECTETPGALLEIGVYGVDGENTVAIPTLWAAIGRIYEGADPSGDVSTDPLLPVWAQLLQMVKQLQEQGVTHDEVDQILRDFFGGRMPAGAQLNDGGEIFNDYANNTAENYSHAEGKETQASGFASHAQGYSTKAGIDCAHAQGYCTEALGINSHAQGYRTKAYGAHSHAQGKETISQGDMSHAQNDGTQALGSASSAAGKGTVAAGNDQFVVGRFNEPLGGNRYLFVVGAGIDDAQRRNVFVVDQEGSAYANGRKVATESYVQDCLREAIAGVPAYTGEVEVV